MDSFMEVLAFSAAVVGTGWLTGFGFRCGTIAARKFMGI